jgi:DNA mismatch repair protein MutS2
LTRDATTRRAHTVEQLLTEVQARQRRLDEERDELEALRAQAERDAREAAERLAALRGAEREERKAFKRKLTDDLLRARAEIQSIVTAAKQERSAVAAREAKRRLSEVEAAATPAPTEPVIPPERLQAGDAVEITGLGVPAVLLESPHGKKRVKVRAGETEVSVSTDRLIGTGGASPTIPAAARRLSGQPADVEASVVVDLRGKAADEALEATVAALDRAALAGHPSLRVIHGHGTGRLKSAIRDYLKESPYVASFRPGDRPEGGDGVTVVQLRA